MTRTSAVRASSVTKTCPSGCSRLRRTSRRMMRAASRDSSARCSGVPRVPISPRVMSSTPVLRPKLFSLRSVPPDVSSASSGCEKTASASSSNPSAPPYTTSLIAHSLPLEIEAAADALLAPGVVDDGDVGDVELPVEVAAAEEAHDLGELVLVDVPLGERDVRRPLVRLVVVRDGAGDDLPDAAPDEAVEVGERGAAHDGDVEDGAGDGEDAEPRRPHAEGARARGQRAQERLAGRVVVLLGDLEGEVRVGRDVHPAHVEL